MAQDAFPVGGVLIRAWTPQRIRAAIDAANPDIRAALFAGDMDRAWALISRKVGQRVCAGDIRVRLRNPPPDIDKRQPAQRPHAAQPARKDRTPPPEVPIVRAAPLQPEPA